MIRDVLASCTDHCGVGRSATGIKRHMLLVSLVRKWTTHLGKELVVEPAHEATDLDAWPRLTRQQALFAGLGAPRFVKIFGDDRGTRNGGVTTFLDQHWSGAGGIEDQKFLPTLPHPLPDLPHR